MQPKFFKTIAAFERWLAANHRKADVLLVDVTPLTLGIGPSLVVALQDPITVRGLLVGLVGLALVGVGVRLGWGAPLVVGGVALGLIAVVSIAPYAAAVPRWVLFGTAGVALLALGVTWERRRQDLHLMHSYAASLR